MSGRREFTNSGTNSQGNSYRAYNDGAYAYKNTGSEGQTTGRYFNDGHGHDFYNATRSSGNDSWSRNNGPSGDGCKNITRSGKK